MRIRRVEELALGLLVVGMTACSSPAASTHVAKETPTGTVASGIAATADVASFGIPATIDGWRLVATIKTMYPETAAIIVAAGADPSTAIDVDVQVYGTARLNFDALRVPGVNFDAFMRAAEPYLANVGLTERSVVNIAGLAVRRYATPADASGRFHAVFYAQRSDLIYATGFMTETQLATLLAGLP